MGQQAALAFAREGVTAMVLGDLNEKGLQETKNLVAKQSPSVEVVTTALNVTIGKSVGAFFDLAISKFGRIDYAVNAAGIATPMLQFVDPQKEALNRCMAVNTKGVSLSSTSACPRLLTAVLQVFLCCRALAKQMVKQEPGNGLQCRGSIINVTSLAGHGGAFMNLPSYTGSKSAPEALTRAMAQDVGPDKIRVNSVAPGFTFTPMLTGHAKTEDLNYVAGITPLRRLGLPEDIANACVFLSSPMAGFITGQSLAVDGGLSLEHYC